MPKKGNHEDADSNWRPLFQDERGDLMAREWIDRLGDVRDDTQ